ncbi:hypothetical protein D3C77_776770 [compost metagenome]
MPVRVGNNVHIPGSHQHERKLLLPLHSRGLIADTHRALFFLVQLQTEHMFYAVRQFAERAP